MKRCGACAKFMWLWQKPAIHIAAGREWRPSWHARCWNNRSLIYRQSVRLVDNAGAILVSDITYGDGGGI